MNKKIIAVYILFLMAFAVVFEPVEVFAQNTNLGVSILQVTPSSATGPVGSSVNVIGTIYISNGSYQIVMGKTVVGSGKAEGYYVDANFTVPELPVGPYALTLRDLGINVNSTKQFTVTTGYAITAVPSLVQEGSSLTLTVSITGAQSGLSYSANIAVVLPNPLGTVYSKTVSLGTVGQKGTASAHVTFPDSSFNLAGLVADYAGTYIAYFNQSQNLAQTTFLVNFIDSTSYHRGQTVVVHATGYQPNQAATLTVISAVGSTIGTASVTASSGGLISTSWIVPSDAPIGDCTIRITADGVQKSIQDSQTFTVIGYTVKVQTTNLAGQVVPEVALHAIDSSTNFAYDATSNSEGTATFKLEKGTYAITASWNGVNVGETSIVVSGDGTFVINCQLSNVKIIVKSSSGIVMPFVNLNIVYHYQSNGGSKTNSVSGQTDYSGSFTLNSSLPSATYTIDASIYNQIFNAGNNTVNNLQSQANAQILIICPSKTVTLNIVGNNQEPIPNSRIELVELSNGLFYSATTDTTGSATIEATFGMYRARVYRDSILINETNVQIFSNSQQQIKCTLVDIQLSVFVVDLFGNPISNTNVTLNGPEKISYVTQSDGKVTFNNINGGNIQIIAQASGIKDAYQAMTLTVNQPTSVQIKIDKYIALESMLVPASALITIIIILLALVLFVLVEIYRRRRVNHAAIT